MKVATPADGHVLIVVQNLSVPRDRRVWLECQALVAEGYRVSVICPMGLGDEPYQQLAGVDIYRYPAPPETHSLSSFAWEFAYCWAQTLRLSVKVRRHKGFMVIQACNPPDTYWLLALFWKAFGVRSVFDQHDLCPEVYQVRFSKPSRAVLQALLLFERLTYRVADHVISTNGSYRQIALGRGKLSASDVTVVRTGPDSRRMRRIAEDAQLRRGRKHLCCYVGVMGPQDGVDLAIRAAHHYVHVLGREDCTFALLGAGDSFEELGQLVRELKLDEYVVLPGWADDDLLFPYLSTADIGLCPDPLNPFNDVSTMNKTMEYMAFELPVVAFDLKETRASAGSAALYVEPNDVGLFAEAIASLLDDPQRRRQMGQQGRHRIEQELDWRRQAPAYVSVFERLIGRPQPGPAEARLTA
jgi:glycosyltransferase involved in cell wall biosynthesis